MTHVHVLLSMQALKTDLPQDSKLMFKQSSIESVNASITYTYNWLKCNRNTEVLTLNSLRQKVIEVSFEMTKESNSSDNRKISVEIDRLSA